MCATSGRVHEEHRDPESRREKVPMWCSTVRGLVLLALLVVPLAAEAQQAAKVYRIGLLRQGPQPPMGLLEELHRLGYVAGHNLVVEPRYAETPGQLPLLAAELVTRKVDLILADGTPATQAAQQATVTIPIVFTLGADPGQSGLVTSYARPGGNVTGFVLGLYEDKKLELLKQAVPGIARVACPCRIPQIREEARRQIVDAARALGLELQDLDTLGLESQDIGIPRPEDFDRFFMAAQRGGADAVLVPNVARFVPYVSRLGELAAQSRLPAIGSSRPFAASGGLLSYGPKQGESTLRVAAMVDKILRGAKPADIPVERHMRFEFVINLRTAQALGLTLPSHLLVLADEVIR